MTFVAASATLIGATELAVGAAAAAGASAAAGTAAATASASILAGGLSTIGAGAYAALTSSLTLTTLLNGASLAWSIGSTLSSMFGGNSAAAQSGPRLSNLNVQSAAFGQPIKRFWGVDRMAGELIWIGDNGKGGRGIREHRHKIKAGKGKSGPANFFYTYDADFAISINGASNCKGVLRIWAGAKLIYDVRKDTTLASRIATGINLEGGQKGKVTFYDGNEDQEPPAIMEALAGVGNCPAYRNQFLAVFSNFDVSKYGSIPSFSFECYTDGEEVYQHILTYDVDEAIEARTGFPAKQASWSYVDPNGEIWLLASVQNHDWQTTFGDGFTLDFVRLLSDGTIIPEERPILPRLTPTADMPGGNFLPGLSDEAMAMTASGDKHWILRPGDVPVMVTGAVGTWFAKKGSNLYLLGNGWVQGLMRINPQTGAILDIADNTALFSSVPSIDQICVGDDFLWGLRQVRLDAFNSIISSAKLVKIDPETLEVLDVIDLGTARVYSFFVLSDDDIKLYGQTALGSNTAIFYEYVDGEVNTLGTGDAPDGTVAGGTLFFRNGIWYVGTYGTWGFYETNIRTFAPGGEGRCVPLWQIQRDICITEGFEEDEINVSELTDCVRGYTLDSQSTGRDCTLPLQRYAFYDARERDLTLEFIKRGHNPVLTIPEADLAARPSLDAALPDAIAQTRAQETELPVIVHVRFKDQDANYETGHAFSARLASESKNVITVDVPVVMTADKAKQIANVLMANYWLERSPKEILITRRHIRLDAADPINIEVAA